MYCILRHKGAVNFFSSSMLTSQQMFQWPLLNSNSNVDKYLIVMSHSQILKIRERRAEKSIYFSNYYFLSPLSFFVSLPILLRINQTHLFSSPTEIDIQRCFLAAELVEALSHPS